MKKAMIAASLLGLSVSCRAGIISQPHFDGGSVFPNSIYGQSFLAEDKNISFGFRLGNANPDKGYDERVVYKLLEGEGLSGNELLTLVATPEELNGYFMMDFSSVNLNIGEMYTATLQSFNYSFRWFANYNRGVFTGDSYANGMLYTNINQSRFSEISDMSFRIEPQSVSSTPQTKIPEPSTFSILLASFLGFVGYRNNQKSTKI